MSRGIAAQNQNPGQWRSTTVESGMLYPQWKDAATSSVPKDVPLRVEVKDRSGVYRLPFKVLLTDSGYCHADKGHLVQIVPYRWRLA